jgi:hypothetical protein
LKKLPATLQAEACGYQQRNGLFIDSMNFGSFRLKNTPTTEGCQQKIWGIGPLFWYRAYQQMARGAI